MYALALHWHSLPLGGMSLPVPMTVAEPEGQFRFTVGKAALSSAGEYQPGQSLAMNLGTAEIQSSNFARLNKRWQSCSHVYPMPPCTWMASPVDLRGRVARVGPGHGDQPARVASVVERPRRRLDGERGALHQQVHVGQLVLDRLERADRPAELFSLLGVLDRHRERTPRRARGVGREGDRASLPHRIEAGRAQRQARGPGYPCLRERHGEDSPGAVDTELLVDRDARAAALDDEQPRLGVVGTARRDDEQIGSVGIQDESGRRRSVQSRCARWSRTRRAGRGPRAAVGPVSATVARDCPDASCGSQRSCCSALPPDDSAVASEHG